VPPTGGGGRSIAISPAGTMLVLGGNGENRATSGMFGSHFFVGGYGRRG